MRIHVKTTSRVPAESPLVKIHYIKPSYLWFLKLASNSRLVIALIGLAVVAGSGLGGFYTWSVNSAQVEANEVEQGRVLGAMIDGIEVEQQLATEKDQEVISDLLPKLITQYHRQPTEEELIKEEQKDKLKDYLKKWKSPFAYDDGALEAFVDSNNMNLMLAIAFVESSMGKKCYYNNCSGIGGYPPNLRKYASKADWVRDFDSLLERKYKGVPVEKFMGRYVQPGSPNWINGVKQILLELEQAEIS